MPCQSALKLTPVHRSLDRLFYRLIVPNVSCQSLYFMKIFCLKLFACSCSMLNCSFCGKLSIYRLIYSSYSPALLLIFSRSYAVKLATVNCLRTRTSINAVRFSPVYSGKSSISSNSPIWRRLISLKASKTFARSFLSFSLFYTHSDSSVSRNFWRPSSPSTLLRCTTFKYSATFTLVPYYSIHFQLSSSRTPLTI